MGLPGGPVVLHSLRQLLPAAPAAPAAASSAWHRLHWPSLLLRSTTQRCDVALFPVVRIGAAPAFATATPGRGSRSGRRRYWRRVEASSAMDASGTDNNITPLSHNAGGKAAAVSPASAIQFLSLIQRLKTTKRTGWVNRGVKDSESIADHMYRMAVMAIISGDLPGVNKDRCVKMAVVHDIAEAIVGDITPSDNVPKEEKNRLESAAINEMCTMLGDGFEAEEVRELWQEYENNSTPEAKLVKDFDKLEMILQALEYETEQNKELDDFFQSTKGKFQTDLGKAWAAEIVSRRQRRSIKPQEPVS